MPKPWHTVLHRRLSDEKLKDFLPEETQQGIDPEVLFLALVKKYHLEKKETIECCVCLDARPIWRRGKWESQTTVGFRMGGYNSANHC